MYEKWDADGVFTSVEAYKSMKLAGVVKYEAQNFFVTRGPNGVRAMIWDSWNKLPPDIQKVFEAN